MHADGGGDGRRLLLLARRVVDGRGRLGGGGVDGRLHRPAAGADDRRVVGGQPVRAGGVGHDDAGRAVGRGGRGGRRLPLVPGLGGGRVVAVVVVVVEAPPPAAVVASWSPPAAAAAVVGVVVVGVLLTLGRVPTATRTATATTKRMRTAAARTIESEPDVPVCGLSSSIERPAWPGAAARSKPFRWSGGCRGAGL